MLTLHDINYSELDYVCDHPGVVLVYGSIGAGKTATANKIAELIHHRDPARPVCYFSLDEQLSKELLELLPNWFSVTDKLSMKDLPRGTVLIVDESWKTRSSKTKMKDEEKMGMMDDLFLSRQRNQTLITIIQSLAMLEKTHFRAGFSLVHKYMPVGSIAVERQELVEILAKTQKGILRRINETGYPLQSVTRIQSPLYDLNSIKYRFVEDYNRGYYKLNLPSFWTEELSVFWSRYS